MGNHEFCLECGDSDFHYHRPCNPERKKVWQEKARWEEKREKEREEKLETLKVELDKKGFYTYLSDIGLVVVR